MRTEQIIRRRRRAARIAAALALVMSSGCAGGAGPPRLPVSGKVTLDGKPLESGTITFIPAGKGLGASGPIADGVFAVDRSEGPSSGSYRVEIVSVQQTGKQIKSPDDPTATIEEISNRIPARYGSESRLQVEVKPDGENSYQFELSSREDKPRGRRVAESGARNRRPIN